MVKQALKRRRPGFNERYYGVRSFSDLLEEAERRGLIRLSLDERSGGYPDAKSRRGLTAPAAYGVFRQAKKTRRDGRVFC